MMACLHDTPVPHWIYIYIYIHIYTHIYIYTSKPPHGSRNQSIGLVGWFAGLLACSLAVWLAGWQDGWLAGLPMLHITPYASGSSNIHLGLSAGQVTCACNLFPCSPCIHKTMCQTAQIIPHLARLRAGLLWVGWLACWLANFLACWLACCCWWCRCCC